MDFARRAVARTDADDIFGMRVPSPDGNGNMELDLCLDLGGWTWNSSCSCSQRKGILTFLFGITCILLSFS
jgi:hypothetical protein